MTKLHDLMVFGFEGLENNSYCKLLFLWIFFLFFFIRFEIRISFCVFNSLTQINNCRNTCEHDPAYLAPPQGGPTRLHRGHGLPSPPLFLAHALSASPPPPPNLFRCTVPIEVGGLSLEMNEGVLSQKL
jgi:hypothetical protein